MLSIDLKLQLAAAREPKEKKLVVRLLVLNFLQYSFVVRIAFTGNDSRNRYVIHNYFILYIPLYSIRRRHLLLLSLMLLLPKTMHTTHLNVNKR